VAVAVMRAAYLEPQVSYTASAAKWPCLCLRCGQLVEPTFNNVSTKRVACKYCAASGLDYGGPACIYVLHHAEEGAVKIGIAGTGARNERILKHQRHGWSLCYRLPVDTGARAFAVEQAVLDQLHRRGWSSYMSTELMPQGGWTETFDAELISPPQLWRLICLKAAEPS
jgi:hypothetical protein